MICGKVHKRKVVFTSHAWQRMREHRQRGITIADVFRACEAIMPVNSIPLPIRLEPFYSKDGTEFAIVVCDDENSSDFKIMTVIGLWPPKRKDKKSNGYKRLSASK